MEGSPGLRRHAEVSTTQSRPSCDGHRQRKTTFAIRTYESLPGREWLRGGQLDPASRARKFGNGHGSRFLEYQRILSEVERDKRPCLRCGLSASFFLSMKLHDGVFLFFSLDRARAETADTGHGVAGV